jgi:prepilin-type N-terminal cleavage/methylation domain-containing protein
LKRAFSLIEVVFAIVIIAISMMSVPTLLSQSSKSDELSIIQESILASVTKIGNILSFSWDGNSYDSSNRIVRVLDVKGGDSELDRVVTTPIATNDNNLRVGHIYVNKRRRFFDFITYGKVYPGNNINSINQFNGQTTTISGSGAYDYKDKGLILKSKVFYISDRANYASKNVKFNISSKPFSNSTNIKMIELNTTSPMLNKSFILRTIVCNIGQSKLLERVY